MYHEDIEAIRLKLAGRRGECWERLDDVVSELCAVHGVDLDEILARVRSTIDSEYRGSAERASPEPPS